MTPSSPGLVLNCTWCAASLCCMSWRSAVTVIEDSGTRLPYMGPGLQGWRGEEKGCGMPLPTSCR